MYRIGGLNSPEINRLEVVDYTLLKRTKLLRRE